MKKIGGYILAGGKSSRMGAPKWQIKLGGRRLIDIAAAALKPVVTPPITIVGNPAEEVHGYRIIGDKKIDEESSEPAGPLVGLLTALEDSQHEWIAVLACDLPFAGSEMMGYLASLADEGFDAVIPIQSDGRPQPLCALYRKESCVVAIHELLKQRRRNMLSLLDVINIRRAEADEYKALKGSDLFFLNLNTPDDLSNAMAYFPDESRFSE